MATIFGAIILLCSFCVLQIGNVSVITNASENNSQLSEEILGIGGGGAVFTPTISPFNSADVMVSVDMGGVYISHNSGEDWYRKNLNGQALTAYFDPTTEGVIYAGGSGLYRSEDNGDNFELFFPNKNDLIANLSSGELNKQYLYTYSGIFPTEMAVKSVLVNPDDSNNVFILMFSSSSSLKTGEIYQTTDGGCTFEKIISYDKTKRNSTNILFDFNKLLYSKEENTLYYATNEGIYKYNSNTKATVPVYLSDSSIIDIVTVTQNNVTTFIAIENTSVIEGCNTRVFATNNFENIVDLTQKIIKDLPTTISSNNLETKYNWSFAYLDATAINNIYLAQASYAEDRSVYAYGIEGILHFDGDKSEWLYGNNPSINNNARNQMCLKNRAWSDGNYKPYGIAVSKQENCNKTILYSTITGVYFSSDSQNFYQRYSKVITDGSNKKYVTSGLDEQTTYGIVIDPFNSDNIFIPNTDFGLIGSSDAGKSWTRANAGVPSNVILNCYDMKFDVKKQGVAYSLWSNRHDVPYSPGDESGKSGAFLRSIDGGKTWDSTYSSGIPADANPVKMSIVFQNNTDEATIYVATFNKGFFVSFNSGKTFTPLNNGITPVEYNSSKSFILGYDIEAKDGKVFALTARSTYGGTVQSGEVFELINNIWQKIELPTEVTNPRDIYYNENTLYISATANRKFEFKNGVAFYNYAGGVYTYKNGATNLIFDASTSATGVQIDSKGTMFISDTNGNIYRKEIGGEYIKIYNNFHSISKGIQLVDDDEIYLSTLGGGLLKLSNLNSLYSKPQNGDTNNISYTAIYIVAGIIVFVGAFLVPFVYIKKRKIKK